jgi:hypothetical protein
VYEKAKAGARSPAESRLKKKIWASQPTGWKPGAKMSRLKAG